MQMLCDKFLCMQMFQWWYGMLSMSESIGFAASAKFMTSEQLRAKLRVSPRM